MIAFLAALSLPWTPIPLRTEEDKRAGRMGGEGAQWPRSLVMSADGSLALLGIDVGGIYRSTDQGRTWSPANVGYTPRGSAYLGIDPKNPKRVLSVGANSAPGTHHGLYLSENGAASWRPVLPANISGLDEMRDQIAFDPASWDPAKGRTMKVFWSRVKGDKAHWGNPEEHPALYRSLDGGETWAEVPNSSRYGGAWLKFEPRGGTLYAGNSEGVFRSTDDGATFERVLDRPVTSIEVSRLRPGVVWATASGAILRSDATGRNWTELPVAPIRRGKDAFQNIKVSPVDPQRIVVWRYPDPHEWSYPRFASEDGGQTWTQAKVDSTGAFLRVNTRQGLFAWDPTRTDRVLSIGGDIVTESVDGGRTYKPSNAGNNGVLVGGMWSFCVADPNTMFFASQDYNGAITRDGGSTWRYTNISGNGWGGYDYAGYAVTPKFLVAGNADGWGGKRMLRVSQDGGTTWKDTGIALNGPDVSFGVKGDPKIAFSKDHRTADGGKSWRKMDGCEGVFTTGGKGELLGVMGRAVVRSGDKGLTWQKVADAPEEVRDLAYDPVRRRVYAVLGDRAAYWKGGWTWLDLPKNQFGGTNARSVAVDPVDPAVVYVASAANVFATSAAMVRSTDAGKTWANLTRNTPLGPGERDGGREGLCVRVHPKTREAWVSTSCYGLWRIGPPTATR